MNKPYIDLSNMEKSIVDTNCDNIAQTFVVAVKEGYELIDFTNFFLRSETFDRFFFDGTLYSQSPGYVLEIFEDEMKERRISLEKHWGVDLEKLEPAYWMGSLFSWWVQMYNKSGLEIAKEYDLHWIYNCYDTLHTTSLDYAIDFIKEELSQEKSDV